MNTRQARADKETADLLRALPESMRPAEARLWLEDYDRQHAKPSKRVEVTVTATEPYRESQQAVPATRSWSRPEQLQTPVPTPERQSTYIGPGWRMNFATRTMERVRL